MIFFQFQKFQEFIDCLNFSYSIHYLLLNVRAIPAHCSSTFHFKTPLCGTSKFICVYPWFSIIFLILLIGPGHVSWRKKVFAYSCRCGIDWEEEWRKQEEFESCCQCVSFCFELVQNLGLLLDIWYIHDQGIIPKNFPHGSTSFFCASAANIGCYGPMKRLFFAYVFWLIFYINSSLFYVFLPSYFFKKFQKKC